MTKENKPVAQAPKIAITHPAELVLTAALEKVNDGFMGGKVPKLELASWALLSSLENISDSTIEKIRKHYFNEVSYLEAVVKQNRATGQNKLTQEQIATLQSVLAVKPERSRKLKEESEHMKSVD